MQLLYAPILKIEETPDGLIVEGIASTETVDEQNDVVDYDSLKAALPDYEKWGSVREMHQPIAAGRALIVTADDAARTVFLRALVVDGESQKKVRAGVLKAFSIGGDGKREMQKRDDGSTYARAFVKRLNEISLVDRPANPDARFTLVKMMEDSMAEDETEAVAADPIADVRKLAGVIAPLQKAAGDPMKIVTGIQAFRNEAEMAGDMNAASLFTQAITLFMEGADQDETPAVEETTDEAVAEGADPALAMAARSGRVRKAGKTFAAKKAAAMHDVAKTILSLLAGAGDTVAQKALTAYGIPGSETDMGGKMSKMAEAIETLAKGMLLIYEAQPAPGGPRLRDVQKVLANGHAPIEDADPVEAEIGILEKTIGSTSNPLAITALRERLAHLQLRRGFRR